MKLLGLISVIAVTLLGIAPAKTDQTRYYLTQELHMGDSVLTACAPGYHTAHFIEVYGLSNMVYDRQLGYIVDDSGYGPPNQALGWVRSGEPTNQSSNCSLWTCNTDECGGYIAGLDGVGTAMPPPLVEVTQSGCQVERSVWCVSDPVLPPVGIIHCDGFESCPPAQ
jgi:hypothetical protein